MSRMKLYISISLLLLIIMLSISYVNIKKSLKAENSEFANFRQTSLSLVLLKQKWEDKKEYKRVFQRIKNISKPNKEIKRGGVRIFDFQTLTQEKFERIMKILLNSNVTIETMDIKRNGLKISLHVEVKL